MTTNNSFQLFQPFLMQLVVGLDTVDVCDIGLDLPSLVLGVLLDLLQPGLLLLNGVVSILEPRDGDEGYLLKGLG